MKTCATHRARINERMGCMQVERTQVLCDEPRMKTQPRARKSSFVSADVVCRKTA